MLKCITMTHVLTLTCICTFFLDVQFTIIYIFFHKSGHSFSLEYLKAIWLMLIFWFKSALSHFCLFASLFLFSFEGNPSITQLLSIRALILQVEDRILVPTWGCSSMRFSLIFQTYGNVHMIHTPDVETMLSELRVPSRWIHCSQNEA